MKLYGRTGMRMGDLTGCFLKVYFYIDAQFYI